MNIDNFVESTATNKTLYTGIGLFTPIAINPDADGIRKIYGKGEEDEVREPVYETSNGSTRIDIFLKEAGVEENPLITKVSFFVSDEEDMNAAKTKSRYINHAGKHFFYTDIDEIDQKNAGEKEEYMKFAKEGLRVAKKGESNLVDFIMALFNLSYNIKNGLEFNNWKKIAAGNVKELEELIIGKASERGRTINVLLGVKDGKYQDVCNYTFMPYGYTDKKEAKFWKDVAAMYKGEYTKGKKTKYNQEAAPSSIETETGNPFFGEDGMLNPEQNTTSLPNF